jgi:hypothetical protein
MGAKVRFETKAYSYHAMGNVMKSRKLGAVLEEIGAKVLAAAREDPNAAYVASLEMRQFVSSGSKGRVSVQIGAHPVIGSRVEAKRGTLSRALGRAGL